MAKEKKLNVETTVKRGHISIDFDNELVETGDEVVKLSSRETDVIALLSTNDGLSPAELVKKFEQTYNEKISTESIRFYLSKLRDKLPDVILTEGKTQKSKTKLQK